MDNTKENWRVVQSTREPAYSASENLGMRTSLGVVGDFPDVVAADSILGSALQRLGIRDYRIIGNEMNEIATRAAH